MRYFLSKFIPVPMRSTYKAAAGVVPERATWWQFRGRIFWHRRFSV